MQRKMVTILMAMVLVLLSVSNVFGQGNQGTLHIYFVRSGQTVMDENGRIQGIADSPLSPAGVETAKDTAYGLKDIAFDQVFTSDRMRDLETADIIIRENSVSKWQEPVSLTQLREPDFGAYEGELRDSVWHQIETHLGAENRPAVFRMERPVEQVMNALAVLDSSQQSESYSSVRGRYQQALATIREESLKHGGGNVLVVADELAINDMMNDMIAGSVKDLPYHSVTHIIDQNGKYQLAAAGDTSFTQKGTDNRYRSEDGEVVIYLIRHGKTVFNTMSRVQGWTDTPLTEEGREVAENLGKGLADIPFSAVYTSDLGRTVETAQLVLKHNETSADMKINKVAGLRETNYGKFDGGWNDDMDEVSYRKYNISTWEELSSLEHSARKILTAVSEADETGRAESYETMSTRVSEAFRQLVEQSAAEGGGNVLVVSHGHAIMGILDRVCNEDVNSISNSSVCKLIYKDGVYTVELVNDKSFIEKGAAK